MNFSPFIAIFITIFLAELGDKTQLATLLFSTNAEMNPWLVFIVASAALILSTSIAVLLGSFAGKFITMIPLKLIAGVCFMVIGGIMVLEHIRA